MVASTDDRLNVDNRPRTQLHVWMKSGHSTIKFQVDTGATCNLLRVSDVPENAEIGKEDKTILFFYNGARSESLGSCELTLETPDGEMHKQKFQVVSKGITSLLGAQAAQEMRIISVNKEYIAAATETVMGTDTSSCLGTTREVCISKFADVFSCEAGC